MGEAILRACVQAKQFSKKNITVFDVRSERVQELRKKFGIRAAHTYADAILSADIVLVAVKPQNAVVALKQVQPYVKKTSIIISIMAGVSIDALKKYTRHSSIVRAMPNTPAQIQQGMTAWVATPSVRSSQKKLLRLLFQSFGKEIEVPEEKMIDAATAVSGSGPAYLFAFAEYLQRAAQDIGFGSEEARTVVRQTIFGAAQLLLLSTDDATTLRKQVTSKKGTTEAAFRILKQKKVEQAYRAAIQAAYKRAREISASI